MKQTTVTFRCTEEFKDQIIESASKEGLSMSAYITRLLKLQINEEINSRTVFRKTEDKE